VKLLDGQVIKAAFAKPQSRAQGSIVLIREWWGLV